MNIELIQTRKVIFEKFNIEHEMEDFFLSFIDGCEIRLSKKYPNFIFYVKNDLILFEQETKIKYFYMRFDLIWSVFENKYKLNYSDIQSFIKDRLETHVKLEGYTPVGRINILQKKLETHVKLEGYTPVILGDLWSTINLFDK